MKQLTELGVKKLEIDLELRQTALDTVPVN